MPAVPAPSRPARVRYRTRFVDGAMLESTPAPAANDAGRAATPPGLRVVGRVDDAASAVRANVRDAARAVLTWLAATVGHRGADGLDAVLDRCLRPGPDVERINYSALAAEVSRVTGAKLSAKRVQTAVTHLRKAQRRQRREAAADAAQPAPGDPVAGLDRRLRQDFDELAAGDAAAGERLRREVGLEVLTAVRAAAGRLIDRDFGEGIPAALDLRAAEGRFLRFLRGSLAGGGGGKVPGAEAGEVPGAAGGLGLILRQLMVTLAEHREIGRAEADMKLVLHGARVVTALCGEASLPGVMAHLNVMVAGRDLADTDLYVAEMLRLAGLAEALHDDAATATLMHHVRRLPEGRRLPSPLRVASYARSNAATRLYDRIHRGELDPHAPALAAPPSTRDAGPLTYLQLAHQTHDAMLARDGGFTLTLTTELLRHVVTARVTGDAAPLEAYLARLGEAKALDRLEALIRYENNDALVAEARAHVVRVWPGLQNQLICVG